MKRKVVSISCIVGEWGLWQFFQTLFVFYLWIITAFNNMGFAFYSYEIEFWCSDVPQDFQNKTKDMKCFQYLKPNESCNEWKFNGDSDLMKTTIISQFNLVCSRSNYASLTQSFYMWGYFISGLSFGLLADKIGRKPVIAISITIEIIALVISCLSQNVFQYLASRLLLGIGSCGRTCAMRTLVAECGGTRHRSDMIVGSGFGWILGYVLLPLLAFVAKDYRIMHLFSIILFILALIWFCFVDESPRFLIINKNYTKAKQVLKNAIKINRINSEDFEEKFNEFKEFTEKKELEEIEEKKSVSILDLIRTPIIRRNTLILSYSSIIIALIYYGFSLNMSTFGGNFYLTFLFSGFIEFPSILLLLFFVKFVKRRETYFLSLLLIVVSCLAVIPSEHNTWFSVCFALLGKFSVTFSWALLDVYSPEIFPTVVRNTGLSLLLTIGRVGSSLAPFMKNLTEETSLTFVMCFYSILISFAIISLYFLPETKGKEIPDSITEAENMKNNSNKSEFN